MSAQIEVISGRKVQVSVSGTTPIALLGLKWGLFFLEQPLDEMPPDYPREEVFSPPRSLKIGEQHTKKILRPAVRRDGHNLYCAGIVRYTDETGDHSTGFCYELDPGTSTWQPAQSALNHAS